MCHDLYILSVLWTQEPRTNRAHGLLSFLHLSFELGFEQVLAALGLHLLLEVGNNPQKHHWFFMGRLQGEDEWESSSTL